MPVQRAFVVFVLQWNIDWHKTTSRPSASRLRVLAAAAAVSVRIVVAVVVPVVLLRIALLATDKSATAYALAAHRGRTGWAALSDCTDPVKGPPSPS